MTLKYIYFLRFIGLFKITLVQGFNNKIAENSLGILRTDDNTTVLTKSVLKYCFKDDNLFVTHRGGNDSGVLKTALSKSFKLFDINNEIFNMHKRSRNVYTVEVHVSNKSYPSLGVVIDISTDMNLTKILEDMKNSIWWNSQSVFLMINRNLQSQSEALKYLKILWNFKILSALYICEAGIYTFNPFTNSAPKYWQQIQVIHERWTLFKFRFPLHLAGPELCDVLYFDKGKLLNGYRLKAQLLEKYQYYVANKTNFDRCVGWATETICNALSYINATIDVKKSAVAGGTDENGNLQGSLKDIDSEKFDITLNDYYLRSYWKLMTYPHDFYSSYVLCLRTPINFKTKFSFFFKWNFWVVFILACAVCIFTLKYVLRTSISLAIIMFVQIVLSSSNLKVPLRFYPRILLFIIIMITSAVNSWMQIRLNWWSSLPKQEASMQSIEDVANSNLTFHGYRYNKDIILQNAFIKKFEGFDKFDTCLDMLNNGEQVACIYPDIALNYISWLKNPSIYKLKHSLFDRGRSYIHVEDFPLAYSLNLVLQHMEEGGLIQFIHTKYLYTYNHEYNKIKKQVLEYETLNLKKLILCINTLLGGWVLAVVAFVAELLIYNINFNTFSRNKQK